MHSLEDHAFLSRGTDLIHTTVVTAGVVDVGGTAGFEVHMDPWWVMHWNGNENGSTLVSVREWF